MDYGKMGAPKRGKNAPKHDEHNAKGKDSKGASKNPYAAKAPKAELLARMKAAAEAKKAE